ncbi:dexh-box atp-dependent rna helicase dexh12 [Quercus suber]|uniref:Dexh-box atp-dependent rna helicase dexh12 n=1 Tax=Quercus suber TaxID=58331 RepID=A0AAW0JV15_QUESU
MWMDRERLTQRALVIEHSRGKPINTAVNEILADEIGELKIDEKLVHTVPNSGFDHLVPYQKPSGWFVGDSSDEDEDEDMMMEDEVEADGPWAMELQPNFDNMKVDVLSIGSYWLQLQINEAYAHSAEDVLKILVEGDDSEVGSKLLFLLRNRLKIVWCALLDQASDAKKYKIEEKMMGLGPEMVAIVHRLWAVRVTP